MKKEKELKPNVYRTMRIDGKKKKYHILMWELYFGVEVPSGYIVHHLDGNKHNNDISNLSCIPRGLHIAIHNAERWGRKSYPGHVKTKEEVALSIREYGLKNKERFRERKRRSHRNWVEQNKERAREIDKLYRQRHREEVIARDRDRYRRNRDKILAQKRQKYQEKKHGTSNR